MASEASAPGWDLVSNGDIATQSSITDVPAANLLFVLSGTEGSDVSLYTTGTIL